MKLWHINNKHTSKGGAVTIAYDVVTNVKFGEDDILKIGFAFCSPHDNFSRNIGTGLASMRLINDPLVVRVKGNPRETLKFVMRLLCDKNFPRLRRNTVEFPFPTILQKVPGWFYKWHKTMQDNGRLCLRARQVQ